MLSPIAARKGYGFPDRRAVFVEQLPGRYVMLSMPKGRTRSPLAPFRLR
jgi:hypothetical protein